MKCTDALKIGIIGGANIAYNRFLPALQEMDHVECVGVASNSESKRLLFDQQFGVPTYDNYDDLLNKSDVDALYIALPPALHFNWVEKGLLAGKHILCEKPFTDSFGNTEKSVKIATESRLAIFENYMFQYHSQVSRIRQLIQDGVIGDVRLFRSDFCFPQRERDDFRYSKQLGGGALLDAGGYVIKLATIFLGDSVQVTASNLKTVDGFDVNVYGSATFENMSGQVLQGSFGMDNFYRCSLEILGNQGRIFTNRIFTAPPDFRPEILIEHTNNESEIINLPPDNHFRNSIQNFYNTICDGALRQNCYSEILLQAKLLDFIQQNRS
ncbi:NDP-hexose-3-ketoreductase [Clostridia bacterium]|nr:NDP-hexose-3-ketoreductase [Clostridia bacterium]